MKYNKFLNSNNRIVDTVKNICDRESSIANFPKYLIALQHAFWQESPPFDTEIYARIFHNISRNDRWLVISLIKNAERESGIAMQLWSFATCCEGDEQQSIKCQAIKKSEHVLEYLELINLTFPDAILPSFRVELQKLCPNYSIEQKLDAVNGSPIKVITINDLVFMNITEIRNCVYHRLQGLALMDNCFDNDPMCIYEKLDVIYKNKLNFIFHTANLIETKVDIRETDWLPKLFCKNLQNIIRNTSEDTVDLIYNLRFGIYP